MPRPLKFGVNELPHRASALLRQSEGSAILEFAIVLPVLVVFIAGIYDFGGAFNYRQKIEQAAQEGAIVAAAQPTSDFQPVATSLTNPDSLVPVVAAVYNSLQQSGLLTGGCTLPATALGQSPALTWTYKITGCSSINPNDNLLITINRGFWAATTTTATSPPPYVLGTAVTVTYPYDWRFYSVIQLIIPGANPTTTITETATVHNQM